MLGFAVSIYSPVGWVERTSTKNLAQHRVFKDTQNTEINKNRVKPNAFVARYPCVRRCEVGFHYVLVCIRCFVAFSSICNIDMDLSTPFNPTYGNPIVPN